MDRAQRPALALSGVLPERLIPDTTAAPKQRNKDQKIAGGGASFSFSQKSHHINYLAHGRPAAPDASSARELVEASLNTVADWSPNHYKTAPAHRSGGACGNYANPCLSTFHPTPTPPQPANLLPSTEDPSQPGLGKTLSQSALPLRVLIWLAHTQLCTNMQIIHISILIGWYGLELLGFLKEITIQFAITAAIFNSQGNFSACVVLPKANMTTVSNPSDYKEGREGERLKEYVF